MSYLENIGVYDIEQVRNHLLTLEFHSLFTEVYMETLANKLGIGDF